MKETKLFTVKVNHTKSTKGFHRYDVPEEQKEHSPITCIYINRKSLPIIPPIDLSVTITK